MPVGESEAWRSWLTPRFVHEWAHVILSGPRLIISKYRRADLTSCPLSDFHEAKMKRTKRYDRGMGWPRGKLDSMEDVCICRGVSPSLLPTDRAMASSG